jgi:hypothetical protein
MHYFLYDEVGSIVYQSSISFYFIGFSGQKKAVKCLLSEVLQVHVEYKTQTFFHFALNEQLVDKNYKRMYTVYRNECVAVGAAV